jgi:hypothetical protein
MRAKQQNNQYLEVNTDSIKQFAKSDFKVLDIKLSGDTLCVISTNKLLFYPFGIFNDFYDFHREYLNKSNRICQIDSVQKVFKIIQLQNEKVKIELVENTETNKLEILSANICDDNFEFTNGIKIGMGKDDMLLKIFTNIPPELAKITVIKLESGLAGIWYYCIFTQEKLSKIVIETDYELN